METMLIVVTTISVAAAVSLSVIGWRLLRDNRRRGDARVATLEALALEEGAAEPVIATSTALPLISRFATLDDMTDAPAVLAPIPVRVARSLAPPAPAATMTAGSALFATAQERGAPKRRRLAMAMVAVVMTAGAAYGVLSANAPFGMNVLRSIEPSVGAARSDLPLALLSLKHDATSDGTFTVTGLVQDPIGGVPLQRVEAIVYLFDDQGNYFAMGRGALEFGALQPGDESPFVVRVPHASRVGRYRVGFRIEGGGAVAHVDRRPQLAPDPAPGSGS